MTERDVSLLEDMLDNARIALELAGAVDGLDFTQDIRTRYAVLHAIQIVGEAAYHVSKPTQQSLENIPWAPVIGARHILVHDYGRVDLSIIVEIVRRHLAPLIEALEKALAETAE